MERQAVGAALLLELLLLVVALLLVLGGPLRATGRGATKAPAMHAGATGLPGRLRLADGGKRVVSTFKLAALAPSGMLAKEEALEPLDLVPGGAHEGAGQAATEGSARAGLQAICFGIGNLERAG